MSEFLDDSKRIAIIELSEEISKAIHEAYNSSFIRDADSISDEWIDRIYDKLYGSDVEINEFEMENPPIFIHSFFRSKLFVSLYSDKIYGFRYLIPTIVFCDTTNPNYTEEERFDGFRLEFRFWHWSLEVEYYR